MYGFCSSGSTDKSRIVARGDTYEYETDGLESNLKKHVTENNLQLGTCISSFMG